MSKAAIIGKSIGVSLVAVMLVSAVVWGRINKPTVALCPSIEYIIEDSAKRMYFTPRELDMLLQAEDIYPVGKSLQLVSLYRIERAINRHPMVRTAECYLTPRAEVRVRITQRVPLLRVQTPMETYLVDTDRRQMQARASVRDAVLLVTGNPGIQMATTQLADFAEWLQTNRYWRTRIHHVQVQSPRMVYLYLRGEHQPRVVMGDMAEYEKKLAKLRTFQENSAQALEGKEYSEWDVRFHGQVIGRY